MSKDWSKIKPEKQRLVGIKGTSGSGKTTIVFKLLSQYKYKTNYFVNGRRQPIAHVFENEGKRPLAVIGHYEAGSAGCGGLDSISHYSCMLELVDHFWRKGYHVMMEGLLYTGDAIQTIKTNELTNGQLRVLALTTSMDDCIAAVNARRRDKDPNAADVNPDNLLSKANSVPGVMKKLEEAGVQAKYVARDEGWEWVAKIFGHDPTKGWQVGEPESKWEMRKEEKLELQSLDKNGERVLGVKYDVESKSMVFDQKLYDKEKAAQDAREARKTGVVGSTDPKAPKVKVSTYRNMIQPADDAPPAYRKFYRQWRQLRRAERKARKAAQANGGAWPPLDGDYSAEWHSQQEAKWNAEYSKLQEQMGAGQPMVPSNEPEVKPGLQVTFTDNTQLPVTQSTAYKLGHLAILEQEVQYLSRALADALARLQAARG